MFKYYLKKVLPSWLINFFYIIRGIYNALIYFGYDTKRLILYSPIGNKRNKDSYIGNIISTYHVIEKGLTMAEMRLGFGQGKVLFLISLCKEYINKFDCSNEHLLQAIGVISEYKRIHESNNFVFNNNLLVSINDILTIEKIPHIEQIQLTKELYLSNNLSSFDQFSSSRHSLRNFSGLVSLDDVQKSIQLAQNAPSACNLQGSRIHIIQRKDMVEKVLSIQNGNRGFGHLVDKLIIVTNEIGVWVGLRDRYGSYIDGGIYTMNLLYALHFYKIGACPLNWSATPSQDKKLRKLINIPNSENIILIIALGGIPDEFKIALSKRGKAESITKII